MKKCSIISFIEKDPVSLLERLDKNEYIICADNGLGSAIAAGIRPDLVIGDLDSFQGVIPEGIPVQKLPAEKDYTDTVMCVDYAIEQGYDEISVWGGTGGRLDHTMGNIFMLKGACEKGARITMYDHRNTATVLRNGTIEIPRVENAYLSIIPMAGPAKGVTIEGAKYTLDRHTMDEIYPLGISNEFAGDNVTITVEDGTLLIILSIE